MSQEHPWVGVAWEALHPAPWLRPAYEGPATDSALVGALAVGQAWGGAPSQAEDHERMAGAFHTAACQTVVEGGSPVAGEAWGGHGAPDGEVVGVAASLASG